ncbi:MAG: hypothetical protein Q9188_003190 [Gyalolechia gomerana]
MEESPEQERHGNFIPRKTLQPNFTASSFNKLPHPRSKSPELSFCKIRKLDPGCQWRMRKEPRGKPRPARGEAAGQDFTPGGSGGEGI